MLNAQADRTQTVKQIAHALGFSFCGIAEASFLEAEAPKLEAWLKRGYHGKMKYLENHFDKRLDPRLLVPGAKSVVSLMYNYTPANDPNKLDDGHETEQTNLKIAKYAYGEDYHVVVKDKLSEFMSRLQTAIGQVQGRVFVDSAPVMERQWASKSGLGWIGKNALLLNKSMGSFFFLAELIIDLELIADAPIKDYCGTCTACVDACPTQAIVDTGVIDSTRCISYLTIELKDAIPTAFQGNMDNWIFGCDVCQDVCPWNRFAKPNTEARFQPTGDWPQFSKQDWLDLTEEVFQKNFGVSAITRTGFNGLKRNIKFTTND
jgi:epoxyqueuosine reductase